MSCIRITAKVFQGSKIEYKRFVTLELEDWYNCSIDKVLMVRGARQVGKTFEVTRFAKSKFENVLYVDLSMDKEFITAVSSHEKYGLLTCIKNYFISVRKAYTDDLRTVLIIDEVQLSAAVFNLLRSFRNELGCAVIMTGSCLDILYSRKDVFLPAGDMYEAEMTPLTFEEFCVANGVPYTQSDETLSLYQLYRKIGGYPDVLMRYQLTNDIDSCMEEIKRIWGIYCEESSFYIDVVPCVDLFYSCIFRVISAIVNEKYGSRGDFTERDVKEILTDIGCHPQFSVACDNRLVYKALLWLEQTGVLGVCSMHKDGDVRKIPKGYRYYVRDLGLANYFMHLNCIEQSDREGFITGCFAYNELRNANHSLVEGYPHCAEYQGYVLDFILRDNSSDLVCGLEVKTSNAAAKSLSFFRRSGLIQVSVKAGKLRLEKGSEGVLNYPIYLLGKLDICSIYNQFYR